MFWLLKSIIARLLGLIAFNYYLGIHRPYYGRQRVYKKILDENDTGIIKKSLMAYVNDDFRINRNAICTDYQFYLKHKNKERVSSNVIGRSLESYGKAIYEDGGETFDDQQRGQVLKLLKPFLDTNKASINILEIGSDNGDVLAHLAQEHPANNYMGVDFSVTSANALHSTKDNISFVQGYALEELENKAIKPDLAYGSSTFMFFTPKELQSYLTALNDVGCRDIFISEPVWAGYKPSKELGMYSRHMEDIVWFHNYYGYMEAAGYKVQKLESFHFKHPNSQREDILQVIWHAQKI